MHETIARSWFYAIIGENWGDRSGARFARSSPQCQRCANVGRFGGSCYTRLRPAVTKRSGAAARQSMTDAATLLASEIAAGGCETGCTSCAEGSS